MVVAGADIIELGVPFSDPMADGPVIQRASERALAHKMSLRKVLELVGEFRQKDDVTPVVLMGYLNPVESLGYRNFVEKASRGGCGRCARRWTCHRKNHQNSCPCWMRPA